MIKITLLYMIKQNQTDFQWPWRVPSWCHGLNVKCALFEVWSPDNGNLPGICENSVRWSLPKGSRSCRLCFFRLAGCSPLPVFCLLLPGWYKMGSYLLWSPSAIRFFNLPLGSKTMENSQQWMDWISQSMMRQNKLLLIWFIY